MNKKKIFPFLFLLFILGSISLQGQGLILKKDITVAEDEVQDNVVSFGGHILIKGKVNENVIAFGGTIIVEGEVRQTVLGFGSEVTLKPTAVVKGDVVIIGGSLDKAPGVIVRGDTVSFAFETPEDIKEFIKKGLFGVFGISLIPIFLIIKLISLFIMFILAITLAALFPRQITFASSQIKKAFWPVFGTGLFSIIVFTMLIIFAALLCFILIGIPILIALVIIGAIIKIFGRVILFYFFGEILLRAFGGKHPSPLPAVILGFFFVNFISLVPILGSPLFMFVLSILGWGVIIRTKFGTTENWFRRTS